MGTFTTSSPPGAMLEATAQVMGWKLGMHGRDPLGSVTLVSAGNPRFPAGSQVPLRVVSGHRDAAQTECPGDLVYIQLEPMRGRAAQYSEQVYGPSGSFDPVTREPAGMRVQGVATDYNSDSPIAVHIYSDGRFATGMVANLAGARYSDVVTVAEGRHTLCVYGINVGPGANTLLGCRIVQYTSSPVGNVDSWRRAPGGVDITGWTIDFDTASPTWVHVYGDGRFSVSTYADRPRSDVASVFPPYGPPHGFDATIPVSAGSHDLCAYGISVGAGGNSLFGCATITLSSDPFGSLEQAIVQADGALQVSGYAVDPDTRSSTWVHIYVDGLFAESLSASELRADISVAFPPYGPDHGFSGTVGTLPVGQHSVCAYAISLGPGANGYLGCASV